ncbi:MAG: secretin N-terminal domain-containing protein [Candidatus Omnitrophica bacterium]|nr:secretin N-terminal domain-containing protein [Candidatus Omnitrophota bacterium]
MQKRITGLISYFLLISLIVTFNPCAFSQDEEVPGARPEGGQVSGEVPALEDVLKDEDIPPEVRKEIQDALKGVAPEESSEEITPLSEENMESDVDYGEPVPGRAAMQKPEPKTPKADAASSKNKISLDLKGVDIIDVLKMLSTRSNMNIVAGRNVRGKVTLFLKDVDIWDAFEIILASNDLAYEKRGDIINVMTERDYEQLYGERYSDKKEVKIFRLEYAKAAEVSKALNQTKSKIGKVIIDEPSNTIVMVDSPQAISQMERMIEKMDMPVETKIFSLNYAKAEDVKTKMTDVLTKGVGTIQVDERTNKVVITDLVKRMPEITTIITAMDEKHKEVLIEAKIVEVELTDEFRYGVDWGKFFRNIANTSVDVNMANVTGISTGTNLGGALTIGRLAHASLDGAISALATVGRTNVISSPRITVVNNEEAKVLIGTNQPYVTSTTTVPSAGSPVTSESVTYLDVGITLRVTPTINNDGFVTMKIKPEVSSLGTPIETAHAVGATGNSIPVVSKSETDTTVMVKDGTTILIAGLIQDRDIETINKVPILGDVPILGYGFKNVTQGSTSSTSNQPEKKEIVIFLTPYIMDGTEVFPESVNTFYGDKVRQRDLLEKQITMAVEDISKKRELLKEPPKKEKIDTNTHVSKDLKWFDGKEGEEATMADKSKGEVLIPPMNLITPAMGGYYGYYENLRNKIFWIAKDNYPAMPKGTGGEKNVRIMFKLTNDGRLKGEPEILNNVDEKLALAAKEAVKEAAPFPPFPKIIEQPEKSFRITISYE